MEYPPVNNKMDFVRRYEAGEFGNRSPTWSSLSEMEKLGILEGASGKTRYHIRNRVANGSTWYDVRPVDLADRWYDLLDRGVPEASLYISEMAPTDKTLIQGEVMTHPEYSLEGFLSLERKTMREALKTRSVTIHGVSLINQLRYYLNPKSWDWLNVLIERYPGHVIEFSTYSLCWGTLPGYNTVFWEVRNY